MPKNDFPPHVAAKDYEAKTSHETARLARQAARAGLPQPFGDPLSGIVLVAEPATEPTGARMVDALRRSLAAVKLDRVYVTWLHTDLSEEILSLEPDALVAAGPTAARAIDSWNYPLAKMAFLEAPEGSWFAWTKGTRGLRLPSLAPALDDADAKRRFWAAFLAIRALVPDDGRQQPALNLGCAAVLLAMLTGLLPDLPFVALSFVLADATSPYKSFSKAEDA